MTHETKIEKDANNRQLNITREFIAPVDKVWRAWTEAEQLDKWWAPKPWRAITKTMDFTVGGFWLYCMAGPTGEKAWCRVDFTAITPGQSFDATAAFCDEGGNIDKSFPPMYWRNVFSATATGSKVDIQLSFDTEADMAQIVGMGFKEGFTMGLGNLDELLARS
ncbi:SRPBCC family protein [Mucilaginibacter sp. UYCu711]|uniref:SRPBCC family protein n=1 Tax=Mucilaginibacter sp. UYCu711 TaxID=3156339 RepID=UPI003D20D01E